MAEKKQKTQREKGKRSEKSGHRRNVVVDALKRAALRRTSTSR